MATLKPDFGKDGLPKLPEVNYQTRERIFTHRSVYGRPAHQFEDPEDDPSPDNEQFEFLGDSVLNLVVTSILKDMYPRLRVGSSTKIRSLVVGNATLAAISKSYNLHYSMKTHPAQAVVLQNSPDIQADLFEAYIGGLYNDQGFEAVKAWLNPLLKPYVREAYNHVRKEYNVRTPRADNKNSHQHVGSATSAGGKHPPTHAPSVDEDGDPSPAGYLALLNQHMAQKNKAIEWVWGRPEKEEGSTTPVWNVKAVVGEECVGKGRGRTKKFAKNEASREALAALGIDITVPAST